MKLFVTDYDNTLYINDIEIKNTIKDLINLQKRDVKIVIATGRSLPSIKKEILRNNIPFDYIACADGSLIYNHNYELIKEYKMNKIIIEELMNDFIKGINYEEIQISYQDGYSNILDLTKSISSFNLVVHNSCFNSNIKGKYTKLKNKYPKYNFVNYYHDPLHYLCIKKKGVSKSMSIKYLAKLLKIKKKDIYVIGDSDNDYEMIYDFHGSCVINSSDKIKEISKDIYNKISDYIQII